MAEEARLKKPITCDQFSKSFYEIFFLIIVKKKIKEQVTRLQQDDRTVDEYAAEFLRLSRFALYMVANEEN